MLLATVLISISLLLAFPDLSTAWLWQLTVLIGTIAWALGAGWLAGPSSAEGRETHRDETAPTQKGQQQGPVSRDFAAIIDAIGAEGKANRNEERREDRDKRSREIVTIGIVAITGAAVIAQVIEMREFMIQSTSRPGLRANLLLSSSVHTSALMNRQLRRHTIPAPNKSWPGK